MSFFHKSSGEVRLNMSLQFLIMSVTIPSYYSWQHINI